MNDSFNQVNRNQEGFQIISPPHQALRFLLATGETNTKDETAKDHMLG